MAEVRFHPITGDPVILSTERADRPGAWAGNSAANTPENCPFCPGHESETPPELERIGGEHWTARAVPNKYPAMLDHGGPPHEVLIDSPLHDVAFERMEPEQLRSAVELWKRRAIVLAGIAGRRYVSVFRNEGRAAGQSIAHPHSQALALTFVPPRVARELEGFQSGPCPMCALIETESREGQMIIDRSGSLVLLALRASRVPFEMWISAASHAHDWTGVESMDLVRLLLSAIRRLRTVKPNAAFNLGVITAPLRTEGAERFHWYLEITPRLTNVAGFEMSTGGWINIESPERAAERLRAEAVRQD